MTLYPPSNWVESTVPVDNGGCGQPHRRPYVNGAPVHPYGLVCPPCEDYLRVHMSDQWSGTTAEIRETYDETKQREDFDKRGAKDKDAILTLALARLAGIGTAELPESLTRMISGVPAHIPGQLECPQGHGQPAGNPFCAMCGSPMSGPAPAAAISAPKQAAEPPAQVPASQKRRLRDARLEELQALAQAHSIDPVGTRADLINKLAAAGVTSNDLARLPVAA